MDSQKIEGELIGLKKDVGALFKAMEALTANVNKLTEFHFKLVAFEEDLREFKSDIGELSRAVKAIETSILGQNYERDINEIRQDRQDLWGEVDKLRNQIVGISLEIARNPPKNPESWWNSRVSEWTAKLVWISLGGVVAWAIRVLGERR